MKLLTLLLFLASCQKSEIGDYRYIVEITKDSAIKAYEVYSFADSLQILPPLGMGKPYKIDEWERFCFVGFKNIND